VIQIRAMSPDQEPGMMPGTLEFITSTGLRYLRTPTPATPRVADLDDLLVATAVSHAHLRAAQEAVDAARIDLRHAAGQARKREHAEGGHDRTVSEYDGQDLAWRRSLTDHIRYRLKQQTRWTSNAASRGDDPPF
jgi:Arc/MetJ family transcription regulator